MIGEGIISAAWVAAAAIASAHAVLHKRDVRAAIGWVGLVWLVPFVGAALYGLFGINRIRRRASELRQQRRSPLLAPPPGSGPGPVPAIGERPRPSALLAPGARSLSAIARLLDAMTRLPLTAGNRITPLVSSEEAFAAMLAAIDGARRSVALASFIFDNDRAGRRFAEALAAAHRRGVRVRVLVDGVGVRYAYPRITTRLRRLGVPVAEFLPSFVPLRLAYANLRNHRKILLVDGRLAFTGGMNIREGYLRPANDPRAMHDVHFRLEGPVSAHLALTFADDWAFTTGEVLAGEDWFPELGEAGATPARGIAGGPDEDFERIRWTLLAALAAARRRVRIVSPYFLPDRVLASALTVAALRGVAVEIVLPRRGNLRLVQWASKAKLDRLLAAGCRVWETPPPFDHAKMMTVDGAWSLIGSSNWDERSLRLNFEFDVEGYGRELAAELDALIDARRRGAEELTLAAAADRPLAIKLRDGAAWLLSPYL